MKKDSIKVCRDCEFRYICTDCRVYIEKEDDIEFSGDEIDISDVVRETILLAQPLNNICSPECRGLCLKCGANLNETDCNCDRHVMDPRLAALQDFFKK